MSFGFTSQFKKDFKKLKSENSKLSSKVMELLFSIEDCLNRPLEGIGQPELLKGNLARCYSRRINQKHRLIYTYSSKDKIELISCYGHYSDK
ncbi:Txe/YoeB family addiction module toxin [Brumimicrobium aurantiacum]|uniref:Putative mRNA interferase YoeB n=1 Tax=Brumimicrobium aurantiacum TaxID=1737063 RepID=A0A3E1EZ77_9FLAO|nr:Txe/YoeB family addiction module toxin [Brumimicrobium aurantiacum]RFC54870.1 Txe/YoeB family addiction module toxin [Brumimicrobium aurantiacum]